MSPMRSQTKFVSQYPHALAMYCSDGRFTESVEELLRSLGHERLDTLTVPGGPCLLELTSSSIAAVENMRSACSFLVVAHHIEEAILLSHEGCGYYRSRFPIDSPESMKARQLADLRGAARWLAQTHPKTRVRIFHAVVRDEHVDFEPQT